MPPTSDQLRDTLERAIGFQYDIIGLLGRGGMGAVYHAHEKALDRPVAIKVLPPDAVGGDARERFLREARTAARLTHPNIVPLFTFGETQGLVYFVMGYVDGESLEQRLRRGPLDAETTKGLLTQLASALDYAHQQGIVHRDVKPDNVLIERGTGVAKLTDFGIAKRSSGGETLTGTGLLMGTPKYMSPEQAAGDRDLDARSDIYALGLVGYAMLTGRPPFDGGSVQEILTQQVTREAPSLRKLFPELESALAGTIERALKKEPAQRWPTAGAMAEAITEDDSDDADPTPGRKIRAGSYAIVTMTMVWIAANLSFWATVKSQDSFFTILPALILFGVFMDYGRLRWSEKKSGSEIKRIFTEPPRGWPFWWPARWRRRDDVWHRLPAVLRYPRIASAIGIGTFLLAMQIFFVTITLGRDVPGAVMVLRFSTILPVISIASFLAGAVYVWRWRRSSGLTAAQAERLASGSTSHPKLWKQPWAARWLVPSSTGQSALEPATPAALADAIRAALPELPSSIRSAVGEVDAAARALATAIDVLDGEIASLSRNLDRAEVERLESRLSALGAESGAEPSGQREMRQLYSSQLDLLKRLARQTDELSQQRARNMELLRTLWRQILALRAERASEAVQMQELTARVRHIVDKVARGTTPSSATLPEVRSA